jgi:hypothetical protein
MSESAVMAFLGVLSTIAAEAHRVLPDVSVDVSLGGLNRENNVRLTVRLLAGKVPNVAQGMTTFDDVELGSARDPMGLVQFRVRETARKVADLLAEGGTG